MSLKRETENLDNFGQLVADKVTAMLAYWDKNLVCRFANTAYLDWFGKRKEDMIDKITLKELLGDTLFQLNKPYIEKALQGEPQIFERDIQTPDGGVRSSLANYLPHTVNGEVLGFVVHVADISIVKSLENELIHSNKIISDQNKRLLNFANVVSHNLNSYANNLRVLLDFLDESQDESEQAKLIRHLKSTVKSFQSTVKNLNEVVEMQKMAGTKSEPVNLFNYVEKVRNILRVQIEASKAELFNHISPDIFLTGNPAYVESIFLNFISNAIKYRHMDRIPEVNVDAFVNGNELEVVVSDNGLGIDLERYRKDLFGMYKTFHSHPDAKGIGLFITKFQIDEMNGRVDVESEVNKGTTFRVFFPMK